MPGRSGGPAGPGAAPERAVGRGLHLRRHTWQGFVHGACVVVDAYARRIVGWRVARTAHASFVLDALASRRFMTGGPHPGRRPRSSPRPGQPVRLDRGHRAPRGSRDRAVGRRRRRQRRQRPGRDHRRPRQGRGDPATRPVARARRRRVRQPGMGPLVQRSPAARAHRRPSARRSRGAALPDPDRGRRRGGVRPEKRPPANPARFTGGKSWWTVRASLWAAGLRSRTCTTTASALSPPSVSGSGFGSMPGVAACLGLIHRGRSAPPVPSTTL